VESASGSRIFPDWVALGSGTYAIDLGVNLWGLALCTGGYVLGCLWSTGTARTP
jgi:SSS family solute:Na+ symporter